MSDPLEEAYRKYISPPPTADPPRMECPNCGSSDVDTSRGYRGEYICKSCRNFWKA